MESGAHKPASSGPVRAAARDEGLGSRRRCLATGRSLPKAELIRFVVAPDGTLTPDLEERLPGRGLWVSAEREALERAAKKGLFPRAARAPVRVPEDLVARIETLLVRRCQHLIGLARRAGQGLAGFEKVRAALKQGEAAVLLAARDGAADGRGKLERLAGDRPVVAALDAAELAQAFGRDRVVHGALAPGGLAERLLADAARLEGLRGKGPEGDGLRRPIDGMDAGAEDAAAARDKGGYAGRYDR
ncbi:MAG TPA: RNA-binding protein [Alphaproteobacteria bacterium]|nr:RNA-binding protein [Alphaproteobacteria bacterium]